MLKQLAAVVFALVALALGALISLAPASPALHSPVASEISETARALSTTTTVVEMPALEAEEVLPPAFPPVPLSATLNARRTVVNLLCVSRRDQSVKSISGSGVVVDPRGVVLTNAHIAQYFLLVSGRNSRVECEVRMGAPAGDGVSARLLYFPARWLSDNPDALATDEPTGTGERDVALLLLDTLPQTPLPFLAPNPPVESSLAPGTQVSIVGYPSEFFDGETVLDNLYPLSANAAITELFTFSDTVESLDLFSLSGSILAQRGASGGAVINADGDLAGLVVTATTESALAERTLRAITLSHISRTLAEDGAGGLREFLDGDLAALARAFARDRLPALRATAEAEL